MSVKKNTVRARVAAIGLLFLSIWTTSGEAALPVLPQAFIDTTYAPPVGNTIIVNAGGNFQAALNNAALGDTIVLQAGATFNGPFTLPNKTTGTGWIYVRSSAYASLPAPGTRVAIADAVNMPKITVSDLVGAAIQTNASAHHYRFVGIEFLPVAGRFVFDLIKIGNGETSLASLPHDITFDRCYVHGNPSVGGRRGIAMDGISVAVVDSYISDFKEAGNDSQALWVYNSPGPLKIFNNYLEGAGENVMTGGADPNITNLVPSDIEIRRNYFFKPLAWIGSSWTVKNLLEFKNGQRILVEGNLFENNWLAAQNGMSILLTPRNQDGSAPWSITQDITIRLNKIVNVGQGMNLSGRDTNFSSQITRRVLIENNVIEVTGLNGADGKIFGITNGPIELTIRHNTGFTNDTLAFSENSPKADQFDFRDNIFSSGRNGFVGTGSAVGTATLVAHYTNYTFTNNAIIGGSSGSYPPNNFFPNDNTAVGFVNFAGKDYTLTFGSLFHNAATDGKDLGADISAIAVAGNPNVLAPPSNLRIFP